jgi:hypothetical protein
MDFFSIRQLRLTNSPAPPSGVHGCSAVSRTVASLATDDLRLPACSAVRCRALGGASIGRSTRSTRSIPNAMCDHRHGALGCRED